MISILDISELKLDLSDRSDWVTVIGTRNPTQSEWNRAYSIGKTLAQRGFAVVSGLVDGLDATSHDLYKNNI